MGFGQRLAQLVLVANKIEGNLWLRGMTCLPQRRCEPVVSRRVFAQAGNCASEFCSLVETHEQMATRVGLLTLLTGFSRG